MDDLILFELESEEKISKNNTEKFKKIILNYLASKNVIDKKEDIIINQNIGHLKNFKTYYAPAGGMYEFSKAPGSIIKKDEEIARYLNQNIQKWQSIPAKENCIIINHCPSSQLFAGMELIQVLEI